MRLYEVVQLFARRLGMKPGRVQAIAGRLQDAEMLAKSEGSRRFPLEITEPEAVLLLIGLLAEAGIATAPAVAKTFGALPTEKGERFDILLADLLFGPPRAVRTIMVRQTPPGVSVLVEGQHVLFGEPPSRISATPAKIVAGETLAAIAAELQGWTPAQADTAAELVRINLTLGRAA